MHGGKLVRMFKPTVQLHIHSPGGRTIAIGTTEKEIELNEQYHIREATKKRMRKGDNLRDIQRFHAVEAAKEAPYALKKRKPPKGTGKGAPGQPRSPFSKQVVSLRDVGTPEHEVVERMILWLRERGQPATPRDRAGIKKRVHYWFQSSKKKSEHK